MNSLAYIDPGSGAMLWQIIVAAMVGVIYTMKKILGSLARVLKRNEPARK